MKVERLIGLALCVAALVGATPPNNGELAVDITNLRNSKGVVLACMTADPKRFPRCGDDPKAYRAKAQAGKQTYLLFTNVAPGRYAIAVLHDENSNGKADRMMGVPKEGIGFSRDAPVKMAPPKFDAAAFDYTGKAKTLAIKIRYML